MEGPQPFMILGHGHEDIETNFDARPILPEGYTLVTLSECGVVTVMETVSRFLAAFKDPAAAPLFQNPARAAHKAAIQGILDQKIHIYKAGNKYPNLTIRALVDWIYPDKGEVALMKSGLYPFPLNPALFTEPYAPSLAITPSEASSLDMSGRLPDRFADPIKELYTEAIFPTSPMIEAALGDGKLNIKKFGKAMTFPLSTFFEAGGPGIYFYVICRSPKEMSIEDFVLSSITNENVLKQFEESHNKIPLIPTLLPFANALAAEEAERLAKPGQKPKWNTNNLLHTGARMRSLKNRVNLTRRMSVVQQEAAEAAEGGRRRRRRKTKRVKKFRRQ